ncbi:MAG TPA: hypothetical protein VGD67_16010 [Pseudonocardiaceae bacterium]
MRERIRRAAAVAAGIVAAATLVIAGQPASAHHAHRDYYQPHLSHMHEWTAYEGEKDEHFCVQIISGASHSTALSSINRALFSTGTPRWDLATLSDGTTNARIDIYHKPNSCSSYPQAERNTIDIEYHVRASNASVPACGGDNISCVVFDLPRLSLSGTHYHYDWSYVYLDADHLGSNQLINHETGHVFGLMDGGPRSGTWDTSCSASIMHLPYYGCAANTYSKPTDNDIRSVRSVIGR